MARRVTASFAVVVAAVMAGCGSRGDHAVPKFVEGQLVIPDRDAEFTEVTREFGPLTVRDGDIHFESARPGWSGPWLPARDNYLFATRNGVVSPLEKYDSFARQLGGLPDSDAAGYERDHIFSWGADSWEGECDAWSAASLIEPEPKTDLIVRGTRFTVADQKSLLIKSYENLEGIRKFGQRFDGTRTTSSFDDIYPDQFHRFLEKEIGERGRPFVMDIDMTRQVWNYPVWMATGKMERDPAESRIMHVSLWIHSTRPIQPDGDYNTVGSLPTSFRYTYDLYGTPTADGELKVSYGVWTGHSLDEHPDFVTQLPDDPHPNHHSQNPQLDPDTLKDLLSRTRQ